MSIGCAIAALCARRRARVSQLYDEVLAGYGIKVTQRSILEHIARAGAPTVSELADAMAMDRSAMTRNLQPLEREGWVKPLVNASDRRSRHVALTATGQAKLMETLTPGKQRRPASNMFGSGPPATDLRDVLGQVAVPTTSSTAYHTHVAPARPPGG